MKKLYFLFSNYIIIALLFTLAVSQEAKGLNLNLAPSNNSNSFSPIDPLPVISVTGTQRVLTGIDLFPSQPTTFTVSGVNISGGILVNVGGEFEVSLVNDGTGYASTVTVGASGTIATTTLYIRLKKAMVGKYHSNIAISSAGATTVIVPVYGTITASLAGGTYLVGASQPVFKNLTNVVNTLDSCTLTGDILFELDADYNGASGETFPLTFNHFATTGGDWKVTIRPKAGVTQRITSGNSNTIFYPIINLDGSSNVTLDGRPGGVGSAIGWIIRNPTSINSGPVIRFIDGAQHNTVTYVQLEGCNPTALGGTVEFKSGDGVKGNSYNTVNYCNIRDLSNQPGQPYNAIISYGSNSIAQYNKGNIIAYNNIFNFFNQTGAANGIKFFQATEGWIIDNNSFYETNALTALSADCSITGIDISSGSFGNVTITNNYIGGSQPLAAGAPLTIGAGVNPGSATIKTAFAGIVAGTATAGTTNTISYNTVKNISQTINQNATDKFAMFYGIHTTAGSIDIDNNTIGDTSTNDNIKLITNSSTPASYVFTYGICAGSPNASKNINNNTIAGVTVTGNAILGVQSFFWGIRDLSSYTDVDRYIANNKIGSARVSNSIQSVGASLPVEIYGIEINDFSTIPITLYVKNNYINGLTANYNGTAVSLAVAGIRGVPAEVVVYDSNTIANLSNACLAQGTTHIMGIYQAIEGAMTGPVISNNIIRGLRLTGGLVTTPGPVAYAAEGIGVLTDGTSNIFNNKVSDITSNIEGDVTVSLIGITGNIHTGTIYNNTVTLTNAGNNTNCSIEGLNTDANFDTTISTTKVGCYHNSIFVGGTNNGNANSYALYKGQANLSLGNNIFINERTGGSGVHSIYQISYNPPNLPHDYNVIISDNTDKFSYLAQYPNPGFLSYTDWKTTTGSDTHSIVYSTTTINAQNLFTDVANGDLSIKNSAIRYVAGKGGSDSGVLTDLNGKTRDASSPTPGAYEYSTSAFAISVSTKAVYNFEDTTAQLSGSVFSSGGSVISEKGMVYGTSANPTIEADTKVTNGSGSGAITVNVTGLTPNTTYHVRAYAINELGTNYGTDVTFTTKAVPAITFAAADNIMYGHEDYAPSASSNNSSVDITYSSDNTAVATIVNGKIHIQAAGTAHITASQLGDTSHVAAKDAVQTLTIAPAPLLITADNKTKVYGADSPILSATYMGFVKGDSVKNLTSPPIISSTASAVSPAGNYPILVTGANSANYTISYTAGTLTVTKAALVITAENKTKIYGDKIPELTASYSGFVGVDNASSLTKAPVLATNATISSGVAGSPYPITASDALSDNYDISYIAGSLIITPAALTATADNKSKTYGDANPALTITYTGFVNGDTPASLLTPPIVGTAATTQSAPGNYPINIISRSATNYAIKVVSGTLTINPLPAPNITAISSSVGISGTTINITGTYLSGATSVKFGGVAASSFIVNSPNNITAVIGAGASGDVSVTTPGGMATLAGFTYVYTLPSNNYKLTINSATCKGSATGAVTVTAVQPLNYTATITGNGVNANYSFSNTLTIGNLAAGTYNVCMTIFGQTGYQQCFTVVITEPKDLSAYSVVNSTDNTLSLSLDGGTKYNISLNGVLYTTTENSITLPLKTGSNELTVTTNALCQGIIKKIINSSGNVIPYPDPFINTLNLNLGNNNVKDVTVVIYSVENGKMVLSKHYTNQSGVLELDVTSLNNGVYTLHLSIDQAIKVFKIIKK